MVWIDIVLLLILAGFVFYGLFFGLIKTIGSLAGVIAGAWVASNFYDDLYSMAESLAFGKENIGKIVAFILLFMIVNRLVCFGFALLDRTFNLLSIIPFLKTINRLAGAFFGFVLGSLILGLALYMLQKFSLFSDWLVPQVEVSQLAPYLLDFIGYLNPIIPQLQEKIGSYLP